MLHFAVEDGSIHFSSENTKMNNNMINEIHVLYIYIYILDDRKRNLMRSKGFDQRCHWSFSEIFQPIFF